MYGNKMVKKHTCHSKMITFPHDLYSQGKHVLTDLSAGQRIKRVTFGIKFKQQIKVSSEHFLACKL